MRRVRRRRRWYAELAVLIVAYWVYRQTRIAVTGTETSALAHARGIVSLERSLGVFREGSVHRAVVAHPRLLAACRFYYGTVHFVVPAVALLLLFGRAPERYRRWRNIFGFMLGLALLAFALYPVLPPEALPPAFRIGGPVRAIRDVRGFSWNADNPYAAMPSLHVAWATWCALALWPVVRAPLARAALVAYPLVTVFVVVATANHYVLDAVGGWLTLAAAWGLEALRSRAAAVQIVNFADVRLVADDDTPHRG